MKDTLHLTLHKKAFDVMVTGEKDREYRKPSEWILSRLTDKRGNDRKYKYVKFVNGYGEDKPWFICEYYKWTLASGFKCEYSNGLKIDVQPGDIVIYLGKIIETGNLK